MCYQLSGTNCHSLTWWRQIRVRRECATSSQVQTVTVSLDGDKLELGESVLPTLRYKLSVSLDGDKVELRESVLPALRYKLSQSHLVYTNTQ